MGISDDMIYMGQRVIGAVVDVGDDDESGAVFVAMTLFVAACSSGCVVPTTTQARSHRRYEYELATLLLVSLSCVLWVPHRFTFAFRFHCNRKCRATLSLDRSSSFKMTGGPLLAAALSTSWCIPFVTVCGRNYVSSYVYPGADASAGSLTAVNRPRFVVREAY